MAGGSGSTQQSTSTSQSASPAVMQTVDKLATGVGNAYTPGQSLYQAPSAATTQGWQSAINAANNPGYQSAINGAINSFGQTASGANIGANAPGFQQLRDNLSNDVLKQTNGAFNSSGLFGSDQNQTAAAQGLTQGLGGLDYSNYRASIGDKQDAASILPSLFNGAQLPGAALGAVGSAQDANAAAQANGPTDYLGKLSSILGGTANSAGTTSTSTSPSTPWWQGALGLGISLL